MNRIVGHLGAGHFCLLDLGAGYTGVFISWINPALHMWFVNICVHKKFTLKGDLKMIAASLLGTGL